MGRLLPLLLLLPTLGCSAEWFRRDADRQVYDLLEERKDDTLGYEPQAIAGPAPDTADLVVPRPAYDLIPETPRRPPVPSPLEPADLEPPPAPLGPPALSSDEFGGDLAEALTIELREADRRYAGDLALGPPAPGDGPGRLRVGLFDGIRLAVAGNREYRDRMEDLYLAALDVTLERHLFRPRPYADGVADVRRTVRPQLDGEEPDYRTALVASGSLGVRQQLPYGGEVAAEATADLVRAISGNVVEAEGAEVTLRAAVPLLRGAGLVNLEPLIDAERGLVYAVRDFERYRRDFAVGAARRYFNLRTRRARVRNRFRRYLSALQLVERSVNLFAADELTALEVQRARQQALESEASLNDAEQDYAAELDDFKLFLGIDPTTPVELVEVELALPEPEVQPSALLARASRLRLDLVTARDRVLDAERGVDNARNGLLPDLAIDARADLGSDATDTFYRFTGDTASLRAGVALELPLDRLRERNSLRRSLIQLDRAARRVEEQEDRVAADVRDALRRLDSAEVSLRIQQENIEVAGDRLELANELLKAGRSDNSRNVVEAQNALLNALDRFESAEADYQIAVLNLLLASGSLRVDPAAGSLGRAMDRDAGGSTFGENVPRQPRPAR